MDNIITVIITALISGLLATIITLWWQRKTELRAKKMKIFETLMAYRYMIASQESVHALNSIDIVFYKDENVRKAYADFLNETAKKLEFNPNIADKQLKLLEEMSKTLGLRDIHWDDIKQIYYPTGLAQKIEDEETLRKLQIQNAYDLSQRNQQQENTPTDKQHNEQLVLQLLPALLNNPESLKMIMEYSKKNGDHK